MKPRLRAIWRLIFARKKLGIHALDLDLALVLGEHLVDLGVDLVFFPKVRRDRASHGELDLVLGREELRLEIVA